MRARLALLAALVLWPAAAVWAGPPFQTDDPEPVAYRHYEFYAFGALDGTRVETDASAPAMEFNWGALPDTHLHFIVPAAVVPSAMGLGDIETGVKYRFVHETDRLPMVGVFPMLELPTGNAAKGLGGGRTWYKAPLWAQKSFIVLLKYFCFNQ